MQMKGLWTSVNFGIGLFWGAWWTMVGATAAIFCSAIPVDSAGVKLITSILGPAVGAGLGALGGIAGGLVLQRRRVQDERTPDAISLLMVLEGFEPSVVNTTVPFTDEFECSVLAWMFRTDLAKIVVAPRLGMNLSRDVASLRASIEYFIKSQSDVEKNRYPQHNVMMREVFFRQVQRDLPPVMAALRALIAE